MGAIQLNQSQLAKLEILADDPRVKVVGTIRPNPNGRVGKQDFPVIQHHGVSRNGYYEEPRLSYLNQRGRLCGMGRELLFQFGRKRAYTDRLWPTS